MVSIATFYACTLQLEVGHVSKKDRWSQIYFRLYPTSATTSGRKVGKLPELVDYHNQTVREFEETLVKYPKGGHIDILAPSE